MHAKALYIKVNGSHMKFSLKLSFITRVPQIDLISPTLMPRLLTVMPKFLTIIHDIVIFNLKQLCQENRTYTKNSCG